MVNERHINFQLCFVISLLEFIGCVSNSELSAVWGITCTVAVYLGCMFGRKTYVNNIVGVIVN